MRRGDVCILIGHIALPPAALQHAHGTVYVNELPVAAGFKVPASTGFFWSELVAVLLS